MGTDISPGTTLVDGTLVHDADLNALVGNATILPTAISAKTLKSDMSLGDELLINDAGTLKKVTGQQIVQIAVVPPGCMMDYAGATEPLGWIFAWGQAISRTTYAPLFAAIGVVYGAGDGSTTFNVPDCRGRVSAGDDNMGGTDAGRLTTAGSGLDGKTVGAVGGSQSITLTAAQMPAHTHVAPDHLHTGVTDHTHGVPNHQHVISNVTQVQFTGNVKGGTGTFSFFQTSLTTDPTGACQTGGSDRALSTGAADRVLTTTSAGGGTGITNCQPTIILNKIIKT
jgi:microcystin-dependent protein